MTRIRLLLVIAVALLVISSGVFPYVWLVKDGVVPATSAVPAISLQLLLAGLLLFSLDKGITLWQDNKARSVKYYLIGIILLLGQNLVTNLASLLAYGPMAKDNWVLETNISNIYYLINNLISFVIVIVRAAVLLLFSAAVYCRANELAAETPENKDNRLGKLVRKVGNLRVNVKEFFKKNKIHPVMVIIAIAVPASIIISEAGTVDLVKDYSNLIRFYFFRGIELLSHGILVATVILLYRESESKFILLLGLAGASVLGLTLFSYVATILNNIINASAPYNDSYIRLFRLTGFLMFIKVVLFPMFSFLAIKNWRNFSRNRLQI